MCHAGFIIFVCCNLQPHPADEFRLDAFGCLFFNLQIQEPVHNFFLVMVSQMRKLYLGNMLPEYEAKVA